MTRRAAASLLLSAAGVALLVWQVQRVGVASIRDGLARVGLGFAIILALSFARFVLRSKAWIALIREPVKLSSAVAATIAGDALGNLTPLSLIVSEPAKSVYLGRDVPAAESFAALTAENFFYAVSVAIYIALGTAVLLLSFPGMDPVLRWTGAGVLGAMAALLAAAGWLAWQQPAMASTLASRLPVRWFRNQVDRLREFEDRTYGAAGHEGGRLTVVVVCETVFHLLSFAEAWLTLRLLTGASLPVAALALDTFSRVSNIVFRLIPGRVGVDQFGSEQVGLAVGLGMGIGTTVSLVRFVRVLLWVGAGLGILARRATRD